MQVFGLFSNVIFYSNFSIADPYCYYVFTRSCKAYLVRLSNPRVQLGTLRNLRRVLEYHQKKCVSRIVIVSNLLSFFLFMLLPGCYRKYLPEIFRKL
jgi:hypothetical protein